MRRLLHSGRQSYLHGVPGASSASLRQTIFASITSPPREYKKKWGFPLKQPLSARMLTRLRSRSAKKREASRIKLRIYLDQKRENKTRRRLGIFSTDGPSPEGQIISWAPYEQRLHSRCVDDLKSQRLKFTSRAIEKITRFQILPCKSLISSGQ